jgi:replicative DNA helicase
MADDLPARALREPRAARSNDTPTGGRELPHNLDLEKAVLAALLDGRSAVSIQRVRPQIEHPLAFFHRDHRIVYLACLELDDGNHSVDLQAVSELLSRYRFQAMFDKLKQQTLLFEAEQLDALGRERLRDLWRQTPADKADAYEDSALAAIGGFNALGDLAQAFGPVASLERNVTLLKDYYLKRKLITRLQLLCEKAYRTPEDFPKLVDEGSQAILELGKFNKSAQIFTVDQVADETLDKIVERQNNPNLGIQTGIGDLDEKLMALRPGGLYILAARPGVGKTSFALKLVGNIAGHAESPHRALFVSLEVDKVDLLKKLVCAEGGISFSKIENGSLDEAEMEMLAGTLAKLKNWKLDLMDVSDLTVQGLRSVVKRRKLEMGDLDLVVLDYLQLLNASRPDMNEYEKVSEISRVLKVMSRELKIPVLALSQMSRDAEKGATSAPRAPKLSDLRGSGSIEQDADAVIFMHRVDAGDGAKNEGGPDTSRKIQIIIAKNRFGPQGMVNMHFFPAKMKFEMAAPDDMEEDEGIAEVRADRRSREKKPPDDEEDVF